MLKSILAGTMALAISTATLKAQEVNFGVISTESTSNLKTSWDPFLADMSKQTGLQIKAFFATDYAGVIEAMRFNKVQVAWYGNLSAIEAVDRANGEVFTQTVDKDGNPGYWSLLIVHKDSPIKTLDDVLKCDKSLDFGIGDPSSTSGYLVPMTFVFAKNKIDPRNCFKTVRAANHEVNALAVANKLVNVAANNTELMTKLKATNPAKADEIRVIWQSPLIPSDPLVWRKDLDPAVKKKLADFLLGYGTKDENEKKVLAALGWAPFRKSDNNQLLPVRQMQVNKEMMKVEGDANMPADKKAAEIDRLRKDFAELERQITATSK